MSIHSCFYFGLVSCQYVPFGTWIITSSLSGSVVVVNNKLTFGYVYISFIVISLSWSSLLLKLLFIFTPSVFSECDIELNISNITPKTKHSIDLLWCKCPSKSYAKYVTYFLSSLILPR